MVEGRKLNLHINNLPDSLLKQILQKLSFSEIIGSRLVCKRWNELIASRRFAPRNPNPKTLLVYCRDASSSPASFSSLYVFNSVTERWEEICLPWIWNSYKLVASNAGLLMFYAFGTREDTLIVCNPLSKDFKLFTIPYFRAMLPDLPRGSFFKNPYGYILVGLIVDEETGNYTLVVAGLHVLKRITIIYNSESGEWKDSSPIPQHSVWETRSRSTSSSDPRSSKSPGQAGGVHQQHWTCCGRCVVKTNNIFWYLCDTFEGSIVAKAVIRFDLRTEAWDVVVEPCETQPVCNFQIASYGEKLMLIHMTRGDNWASPDQDWPGSERMMELSPEMMVVMPVDMLQPIVRELQLLSGENNYNNGTYYALGNGEEVYHVLRGAIPGVQVAAQNADDMDYRLLPFWPDRTYTRQVTEFWLMTPSFRAFV